MIERWMEDLSLRTRPPCGMVAIFLIYVFEKRTTCRLKKDHVEKIETFFAHVHLEKPEFKF